MKYLSINAFYVYLMQLFRKIFIEKVMKCLFCTAAILALSALSILGFAAEKTKTLHGSKALHCLAFSPYIEKLNPDYGPHPSKELIGILLDQIVKKTPFRCIMTYGVLNGLDAAFEAAQARGIKVIAILWLDKDSAINSQSIAKGIELAKTYTETIVRISCGSEVRTRHNYSFDSEISRCMESLRKAGVKQPITTIDTWWEWCNRSLTCAQTSFAKQVDWIGINVFPWWENKHSGIYPCTPAAKAADFHIARIEEMKRVYPGKEVIITEFGWPYAPKNGTEINEHTKQHCGKATKQNQELVVKGTLKQLAKRNWPGVVFEAFSENWKPSNEGDFGGSWGICQDAPPYDCIKNLPRF